MVHDVCVGAMETLLNTSNSTLESSRLPPWVMEGLNLMFSVRTWGLVFRTQLVSCRALPTVSADCEILVFEVKTSRRQCASATGGKGIGDEVLRADAGTRTDAMMEPAVRMTLRISTAYTRAGDSRSRNSRTRA